MSTIHFSLWQYIYLSIYLSFDSLGTSPIDCCWECKRGQRNPPFRIWFDKGRGRRKSMYIFILLNNVLSMLTSYSFVWFDHAWLCIIIIIIASCIEMDCGRFFGCSTKVSNPRYILPSPLLIFSTTYLYIYLSRLFKYIETIPKK